MLLARFGISSPLEEKQVQVLQDFYDRNRYPTSSEKDELAQMLSLSTKRVQHWFQWKRYKDKNKWFPEFTKCVLSMQLLCVVYCRDSPRLDILFCHHKGATHFIHLWNPDWPFWSTNSATAEVWERFRSLPLQKWYDEPQSIDGFVGRPSSQMVQISKGKNQKSL